ncbi:MAG: hypothetical protein B6A08_10920 [Sorangiineae bacterium NIC37A_2]|jgi:hypothetical protein|nr:MAG: hypothetical protein B6A08_10920 [Sorangiineae bacterium NIC37A_2]
MSEKLSFRLVTGRFAPGWVLASVALLGCQSPEVKACHTAMTTSQGALLSVDKESRASVESVLAEVEKARDACKSAGLKSETKSTEDAVRSLRTLLEVQQERAKRAQVKPLSPEEQAELIKKGDPSCPRGEAYQLGEPPKLVRCTGATLFEMDEKAARAALERDGYRFLTEPGDKVQKAEHGSKTFLLEFGETSAPPICVRALAKPGVPWQETAARLLGVQPQKLMAGKKVSTKRGEVLVQIEGAPPQETVLVGDCERWVDPMAQAAAQQ